ncbi:MAG TPA: hypothetical protein DHV68_07750 [Dehalococcoidia bacterium]|nr:hypothetical protein [Chloroflexota bacterium]HCI86725.1 hypothetical protein [Dehalococcoidia bacterium]
MFRLLAIRSLVFPFLKLVWRLFIDKRVPAFTKIIPILAIAYIFTPYDIIGDRIPILGQFDDLIVTGLLFLSFIAASPKDVLADQTLGRKLRDMQKQAGFSDPPRSGRYTNDRKTVKADFKYVKDDSPEEESSAPNK